jgi:hypothetical protein
MGFCLDTNRILGYRIPVRFKLDSTFTGGFDGLVQVGGNLTLSQPC